ncbi:pentatricopeptide repeat-containing protein At1g04840 [Cucurbita pepo subsp. pepo]|uniref:pentatricopeptide repeat-containing protein At1g04840 n=1 Tax=Cucurbita pepo subsp. pepo TaxID=3664 RepID=UPI000C9D9BF1|nr:pentatricopeptide repeat-containing protein At1g04840 [Cucurbita pepo subsp. pepo]
MLLLRLNGTGSNRMKNLHVLFKPRIAFFNSTSSSSSPQISSQETHFIDLIHASDSTHKLRQIHGQLYRCNIFSSSRVVTQFISSCSSLNSVDYAVLIFQRFELKNSFLFNALIRGLAENSRFESSIAYFVCMLRWEISPDRLTFPFVLKSAAALSNGGVGSALHSGIVKFGLEFDSFVRVSLVDMYVKVDDLGSALKVFDESPDRIKKENVLIWNVLIHGYCRVGNLVKATELFETMPKKDTGSWNSLINGFMRKGQLGPANELFEKMPEKNVVSWTTMVNGFSQNGDPEKALQFFFCMLEEGARPNDYTIVSALSACAKLGALDAGLRIHRYLSSHGFKLNQTIGTALVDMYAKCGNIESAGEVFREIKQKGLLTWSVMIWGWAIHGHFKKSIQYFEWMKSTGTKPDGVVFLAVLTACSHSGQVDDGLEFFDSMRRDYLIEPSMKHYTLIVDMLGRAGRLDEALKFLRDMPINPDFVVWGALFCACRAHKNIKMAELASEKLLELEPKHPGSYVFLSNAYAAVGRWEDAERVRVSMRDRGAQKDPGWSFMEVDDKLHRFVAGDNTHNRAQEIYSKLDEINAGAREKGYTKGIECVLHNIEEEEKEEALGHHSEKLALAFGLVSTAPETTIRIVKNLRVCVDCHSFMKYASKMSQREIILRDMKRFHHFHDGVCSCGDYW